MPAFEIVQKSYSYLKYFHFHLHQTITISFAARSDTFQPVCHLHIIVYESARVLHIFQLVSVIAQNVLCIKRNSCISWATMDFVNTHDLQQCWLSRKAVIQHLNGTYCRFWQCFLPIQTRAYIYDISNFQSNLFIYRNDICRECYLKRTEGQNFRLCPALCFEPIIVCPTVLW